MYKNYTSLLLITVLFLSTTVHAQNSRKVLFIGNSYTQYNNLPNLVAQIATSMGDTLISSSITPGGQTLQGHSTDVATLNAIKQDQWDVVVLQEQSQRPAFSPTQVASDVYPYAKRLVDSIRANNSCTQPMFYMTWGRKNGDAANCPFYTPICTYEGMQQRLRESYMDMAQQNNGITAPVGAAWKVVRDSLPNIDLYNPDESHPSLHGSYLAACVFYASIFHRNPHGSSFTGGLSSSDAERLQYFAGKIAMDSLSLWLQHSSYVYASFTSNPSGLNVSFSNTSLKAVNHNWDFGDGNSSTQINPNHTYAQGGKYTVILTAYNNCSSERAVDTINNGGVGINHISGIEQPILIAHTGHQEVSFKIADPSYTKLFIYSITGALLKTHKIENNTIKETQLPTGVYLYKLKGTKNILSGKFNIY